MKKEENYVDKGDLAIVYETILLLLKNQNFFKTSEAFREECEIFGFKIPNTSGKVFFRTSEKFSSLEGQVKNKRKYIQGTTVVLETFIQTESVENSKNPGKLIHKSLSSERERLADKFQELQNDYRSLLAVTSELTYALQVGVVSQAKNIHIVLDKCKTIYPSLFAPNIVEEHENGEIWDKSLPFCVAEKRDNTVNSMNDKIKAEQSKAGYFSTIQEPNEINVNSATEKLKSAQPDLLDSETRQLGSINDQEKKLTKDFGLVGNTFPQNHDIIVNIATDPQSVYQGNILANDFKTEGDNFVETEGNVAGEILVNTVTNQAAGKETVINDFESEINHFPNSEENMTEEKITNLAIEVAEISEAKDESIFIPILNLGSDNQPKDLPHDEILYQPATPLSPITYREMRHILETVLNEIFNHFDGDAPNKSKLLGVVIEENTDPRNEISKLLEKILIKVMESPRVEPKEEAFLHYSFNNITPKTPQSEGKSTSCSFVDNSQSQSIPGETCTNVNKPTPLQDYTAKENPVKSEKSGNSKKNIHHHPSNNKGYYTNYGYRHLEPYQSFRKVANSFQVPLCYVEICRRMKGENSNCRCTSCVPGQSKYYCGCYEEICNDIVDEVNGFCKQRTCKRGDYFKKMHQVSSGIGVPTTVIEHSVENEDPCNVCAELTCECAFESRPRIHRTPPDE